MSKSFSVPAAPAKGLNPLFIEGLKEPPGGGMYEVSDIGAYKSLRVRVSSQSKVFYMSARWKKGATSAASRAIGLFSPHEEPQAGCVSLAQARAKVAEWDALRKRGIDPAEQEREAREAEERAEALAQADAVSAREGVFYAVAEAFLARSEFRKQRRAKQVEREIRNELLDPSRNGWHDKHISEIDDEDVFTVIAAIRDRPAPYQAINVLTHIKQIFSWAMRPERRKLYKLKFHPIAHLKPRDFDLKKEPRQTLLKGDEIRAYWRATEKMGYPYREVYRLLLVTGQRKSEIAQASWPEFDMDEKVFTVPPERFKSNASHMVPLSDLALEILATVEPFEGEWSGPFLFSTRNGRQPIDGFGNAKKRLDKLMLAELKAMAEERGDDPEQVALKPFVNHDMRRICRTALSSLRVPEPVAELIIGHGKKGLARVYNQHEYLDEMREGLQLWADRLRTIINPPAAPNVVQLRKAS